MSLEHPPERDGPTALIEISERDAELVAEHRPDVLVSALHRALAERDRHDRFVLWNRIVQ